MSKEDAVQDDVRETAEGLSVKKLEFFVKSSVQWKAIKNVYNEYHYQSDIFKR